MTYLICFIACFLAGHYRYQLIAANKSKATTQRALQKARAQRDTAQLRAERATASLREIRPLLELPDNAEMIGFSYSRGGKSLGNSHCVVIELDRRFLASGAGLSWKAASDAAVRHARQQEHFKP